MGCSKDYNKNPLPNILSSNHPKIKRVMDSLENHEIQIKLSEITKNDKGEIAFKDYEFQVNDSTYFYPASTVKLPIAILALEKVEELENITSLTPFHIDGDSITTTLRKEIEAIFAVSSNEACNRLIEFLGFDYINGKLKSKQLQPVRIAHRLSAPNSDDLVTKAVNFIENDAIVYKQLPINSQQIRPLILNRIKKGKGYYKDSVLVNEPMDFSLKNYLPITIQSEIMKRLQFPNLYEYSQQFHLNDSDYNFLIDVMQKLPYELGYDKSIYNDGYVKFFMYGDTKEDIPDHINIHNKVGDAFGYLMDNAYIVDTKYNVSFLVTATIHVNRNGIFNDDDYEYDSIGFPFLAELGRQLHSYYIEKELYLDKHRD